jgi:H+/Cl- antiporter ClcA
VVSENNGIDDLLGKIWLLSYRYTWIFAASAILSIYLETFIKKYSLNSAVLSALIGFVLSILIEQILNPFLKKGLLWINRISDHPKNDPRLMPLFDGWSAFITSIFIAMIFGGIFNIQPSNDIGIYKYLIFLSGGICFLILFYGIITKKI